MTNRPRTPPRSNRRWASAASLRGNDIGDAWRHHPILHLPAQPVQSGSVLGPLGAPDTADPDAPPGSELQSCTAATAPPSRMAGTMSACSRARRPPHPPQTAARVANPLAEPLASGHDRIRAEGSHQLLIGRRRVGEDNEAIRLGQLHDEAPEGAGGARHQKALAGGQSETVECHAGGHGVHQEGRGGNGVDPTRAADHALSRNYELVGVRPPVRPVRHDQRDHRLADGPRHLVPDCAHHP